MKEIPYGQEDFYKEYYPEEFKEYEDEKISITRREYNALKEDVRLGKHYSIAYPNLLLITAASDIIVFSYLLNSIKRIQFDLFRTIVAVLIIAFISFLYTYLIKYGLSNLFKMKIKGLLLIIIASVISIIILLFWLFTI